MKKAKLIYNPYSGDRSFRNRLDSVIDKLQSAGYEVTPYRTMSIEDIYESVKRSKEYDAILISGGDGTINHVINAMVQNNIDVPVGIFPYGTANDFASHLGIPRKITQACDIIAKGKLTQFDLGKINDRYFINVAAGGLLTDVSQKIDINMKNTLGKVAYYLKGIEQLPNFRSIPIKITCDDKVIEENIYLFVILNGSSAGGFKLAPDATANDELLNLIAIKQCSLVDLFNLFIKMLKGEHLESNNVIYLRSKNFKIECYENIETDIDGEVGPNFPLDVSISSKKIKIFTP
ncbi:YegS/Rv2252/BmrU family lipid kinase [Thermobrachium celere]|uniref:Transcription regulator [contains diacylglycerol kinase catalytic domain] n=1 Tax=Thermobrachium celere DSM 8682 TaxID=941824 RepID=R7RQG7_9CLOT|nr:YegS/Rv2252/BmrU family lipid kinase [Thermobrachium celere]CDF57576.1 Transcription regulator [contains diacylglycerol kinase catalytic domain] [Thermobrachium celere DSM 8682]